MAFEEYIKDKKAFILGLDNVLYPEKDYLLQVYYLFAEFIEYTEQINAAEIIAFMQSEFAAHGDENIFEKTAVKFNIPEKYKTNFELLHENARLPLKLLLYQQVLSFLQEVVVERKEIFLLVDGEPLQQVNKIKQLEWHGLEKYLKVYFSQEFVPKPATKSIEFILDQHALKKNDILMIGNTLEDEDFALNVGVDYLTITKLL
ncbi:HAD hydrolase-like protein [Pedobacter sp. LMG 31464]|uniref:HAD hydrolase-like protein n=1 Tax=Pedobacter planticolens TaxID=2679964 RepID=A0A923DV28_9SPHI|nr:HAD hydrolase-like protein [Pedobacter planticolens]MBB2144437.1 HAD hydrolase-like protein [Pedobacter planticolens]